MVRSCERYFNPAVGPHGTGDGDSRQAANETPTADQGLPSVYLMVETPVLARLVATFLPRNRASAGVSILFAYAPAFDAPSCPLIDRC